MKTTSEDYTLGQCRKCKVGVERRSSWCRPCLNKHKNRKRKLKEYTQSRKKLVAEQYRARRMESGDILPETTPTFYANYKEPLRAVETGYGYYGTIGTDESGDFIQCHECGKLFRSLGGHIRFAHKMTARQYKEKFQLSLTTALIGEETRNLFVTSRQLKNKGQLREGLVQYNQDLKDGVKSHKGRNGVNGGWTLERYNKEGLCPDQTLEAIRKFADTLGRTPSYEDFTREFNGKYHGPIKTHFGGWTNAVRLAGMIPIVDQRAKTTNREMLIEYLKDFYKRHGRNPMNSDFKRGIIVPRYNYYREFGTLNDARIAAGIPAVIPMPGRRYMEIPVEQFMDYQAIVESNASKISRARNKVLKDFNWEIKEQGQIA